MQFIFRRDEAGRERIYVGDVCVAVGHPSVTIFSKGYELVGWVSADDFHAQDILSDAIELADEAGFWERHGADAAFATFDHLCIEAPIVYGQNEITVDVPVADTDVQDVTRVSGRWRDGRQGYALPPRRDEPVAQRSRGHHAGPPRSK